MLLLMNLVKDSGSDLISLSLDSKILRRAASLIQMSTGSSDLE